MIKIVLYQGGYMSKIVSFLLILLTSTPLLASPSKSICGIDDNRVLSFEPRIGRLSTLESNRGCTATLISDSCAITAGHCERVLIRAEFNTPISQDTTPQPSSPEDVYMIDQDSISLQAEGPGKDWAVFKFKPNEITGRLPGEVQGYYDVSFKRVSRGSKIRITGYGRDTEDDTGNFAQQTHTGELTAAGSLFNWAIIKHTVDTMGGNSGSSIILEKSQKIIGVHSHAGCEAHGGSNKGTYIKNHSELKAAIKACLE